MKMYTIILIVQLLMIAIPDIFFYRHLKKNESKPVFLMLHLIPAAFFTLMFLYMKFGLETARNFRIVVWLMWLEFVFFLIYIPKLLHIGFYFMHWVYQKITKKENHNFDILRIVLTVIVVVGMLISAYITPRSFDVTKVEVEIQNLPPAFEGYKIVQLSDLHLGSWNHKYKKLSPVIDLTNMQHPDMVVFTGDIVNNYADEAQGWEPYFKQINARDGKVAILGNHDYGDYASWKSETDMQKNRNGIREHIRNMGFRLLLNEHFILKRNRDSIVIAGVENWGKRVENRYSNLTQTLLQTPVHTPVILLAHDPTEWDEEIVGQKDIALTLSGHTHAAQLGLKINDWFISPASLAFRRWAGLYREGNQFLYVNRGIGYIGLPMSVGVRPEITVITLTSGKKTQNSTLKP